VLRARAELRVGPHSLGDVGAIIDHWLVLKKSRLPGRVAGCAAELVARALAALIHRRGSEGSGRALMRWPG
jgi:hypothetical protein